MPQDNPPLLDKTMNTTESTPRNIADVLADELVISDLVTQATAIVTKLQALINAVKPNAGDIPLDPITGMSANNVQLGISELKGTLDSISTNFSYQTLAIGNYASTTANYEYVGLNFTIPTGKHGLVTVSTVYISKNPLGLGIGTSDSTWSTATKQYWLDLDSIKYTPAILLDAGTYYVWAKRDGASSNNPYFVKGLVF
jgi:hypothetical protein